MLAIAIIHTKTMSKQRNLGTMASKPRMGITILLRCSLQTASLNVEQIAKPHVQYEYY